MICSSLCIHCAHRIGVRRDHQCAAFPDGIPLDIINGRIDHRLPVDGDHGIRYEHASDLRPEIRAAIDSRPPLAPLGQAV